MTMKKFYSQVGNICVGLYLYVVLMHPLDTSESIIPFKIQPTSTDVSVKHIGLLELSGGYKNVPGLCLYGKFGFIVDDSLTGQSSNCFRDTNNIGMINNYIEDNSVDIEERKQKIINIVNKVDAGYEKHVICVAANKEAQQKLIEIYSAIKINTEEMNSLVKQSKFPINKDKEGNLVPEFKRKMDEKIQKINDLEDLIKAITHLSILEKGGKKKRNKKTKKRTKKSRYSKTRVRRH